MAEVFGIITGVIGVVSPFVSQLEQFVQRCRAVTDNPADLEKLVDDSAEIRSRFLKFKRDLSNYDQQQSSPAALDAFRPTVKDVESLFESAKNDLNELERTFPPVPPSSRVNQVRKAWRKGKHFVLANKFARTIETISQTVNNARLLLNPLIVELESFVTLKETNIAVKETLETLKQGAPVRAEDPKDQFTPQFLVPAMLPNIVLDFCSVDENGESVTMEGKLKQALLCLSDTRNDSAAVAVAVGVAGMGGVGKTSALIGLGWEADLRGLFSEGGVYFVSIGKDASEGDVIKKLAHITRRTGGTSFAKRVMESESLSAAVEEVVQWFRGRSSFFLFDDLWETENSRVGYLPYITQLVSSCSQSRMVISTRSDAIALESGERVKFEPRDPNGGQSRRILLEYADAFVDGAAEISKVSREALETVLEKCGGVPLTLGVAGRAIREMTLSCSGNWAEAVTVYARDLEAEISAVGSEEMGLYPSFYATIRTSLSAADRWSEKYELRRRTGECTSCSKLFNGLCVLQRQTRAPREMLKRLWCITDDRVIHDVIRKFADLNLIWEERFADKGSVVAVHDLILEFCIQDVGNEAQAYHGDLLNEYIWKEEDLTSAVVTEGNDDSQVTGQGWGRWCRRWWEIGNDGYISEQICRHLVEGGCIGELVGLLSDLRWTETRVRSGELLRWHEDFKYALKALEKCVEVVEGAREGLVRIRDAAHDGWGFTANNIAELPFQMQSRLHEGDMTSWMSAEYLKSIAKYAKKPRLRCEKQCWPEPGTERSAVVSMSAAVLELKLAKDGRIGVVVCGNSVVIVNMETLCIISSLAHDSRATCVAVTPTGSRIVSGSDDGTVRIWDGENGESVCEALRGHEGYVTCVAISKNGSRIVSGSHDGTVCIWDGENGESVCEALRGHGGSVTCVAISKNGSRIVSGSDDGTVCIWDGENGESVCEALRGHGGYVTCVAISKNGSRIVSGFDDGTVRIWDGENEESVCEALRGHGGSVTCVAISKNGSRIVSGSADCTVRIWDGENGESVCEALRGHEGYVYCVAISENGNRIVSGSYDGTVRIWDGENEESVCEALRGHEGYVTCVATSKNGSRIVSGSYDGTVCIWDGENGESVCEALRGHEDDVNCVAISENGSRIVSGSYDGTLRTWDWNGVAFKENVILERSTFTSMGDVIRVVTRNRHVKYWRRDVEAGLMEVDRSVRHECLCGASSVRRRADKWEVHVCGRQVLARNSASDNAVVLATLPSKAVYDNWGTHGFQTLMNGDEDSGMVAPFTVWLKNNSVLSLSLVVPDE